MPLSGIGTALQADRPVPTQVIAVITTELDLNEAVRTHPMRWQASTNPVGNGPTIISHVILDRYCVILAVAEGIRCSLPNGL